MDAIMLDLLSHSSDSAILNAIDAWHLRGTQERLRGRHEAAWRDMQRASLAMILLRMRRASETEKRSLTAQRDAILAEMAQKIPTLRAAA